MSICLWFLPLSKLYFRCEKKFRIHSGVNLKTTCCYARLIQEIQIYLNLARNLFMMDLFDKGYLSFGEINGRVTSVHYQIIYLCPLYSIIRALISINLSWQKEKAVLDEASVSAKSFLSSLIWMNIVENIGKPNFVWKKLHSNIYKAWIRWRAGGKGRNYHYNNKVSQQRDAVHITLWMWFSSTAC